MDRYSDLSENARDILMEISNIGTGNAISALAEMVGRRIDLDLPQIRILEYRDVPGLLGGAEEMRAGILLDISGDLKGMFLFLLDEPLAVTLIRLLLGDAPKGFGGFGEMERSALCEIGNIMCCSYLNAMAKMMGFSIQVSVPDLCCDMTGAILSVPMIHFANLSDELLFMENRFGIDGGTLVSHVLFLPEMDSLSRIFQALGETYE